MRPRIDLRIVALAATQHGVVHHDQLLALGLGLRGIAHRVAAGRLHRLHVGVYAVGRPDVPAEGRWMAAVLACGPGAALSHRSAAALWAMRPWASARVHVAVPTQAGRAQPEIVVHRCATLHPDEVTVRGGIAVTTVARTLFDLARRERPRVLAACVEAAVRGRVFDLGDVDALLARRAGQPGSRRLALAVELQRDDPPPTRSGLERRFLELVAGHGLPAPSVNATVLGYEVDFLWAGDRLVVETDTRLTHGSPAAFERDRERDADLAVAGYRVVRFTDRGLRREPDVVASMLSALLARRAAARPREGRPASWP
jgi:predicted transcriptional regulator of viral defense system